MKYCIVIPALAIVLQFGTTAWAQTAQDASTAKVAAILAEFEAAYDREVAKPNAAAVAALDEKYLAAVNRALNAAAEAGNLDEALKLREEATRITARQPLPATDDETLPAALKTLRATYRAALAKLEEQRAAKAQPYYDHYDKLLEALQVDLTKQQRIDDALAVKAKRDQLRQQSAASAPGQTPAASPQAVAAATPAVPGIPDPASQEKFIDMIFTHKGEVTVSVGGKASKAKTRQELPSQVYELTEIEVIGTGINDRELAPISAIPSLKIVRLSGKNEFTTLKHFATLPNVRVLKFEGGTPIKEAELAHLAGLMALEYLTLELKDGTGEGLAHLRGKDQLKEIKLIGVNLSAAGAQAMAAMAPLTTITLDNFDQRKNQAHIAALAALPHLTRFSLTHCQLGEDAFKAVATLKNLLVLDLSNSEFDNAGFAHLAPLGPTLKNLDLQYSATVSDEGLRHIAAHLPNLETISVSIGATCTGDGIRELAKLPKLTKISWWVKGMKAKDYQALADLPAIERITLNGTEITDDGLSSFPKSQTLTFLNLDTTAITDKGLAHLQAVKPLREVVLKSTKVTDAGVAAFQKARPDVKVSR